MSERRSVRFGDTTVEYEVRRSERRKKTVQITVDGGGVQVAAPSKTPESELRAMVRKRALWILSHASDAMLEATPKRFVSGETLPYLGRNVDYRVLAGEPVLRSQTIIDPLRRVPLLLRKTPVLFQYPVDHPVVRVQLRATLSAHVGIMAVGGG